MEELVSIGVPVFNGENYLRHCLDSLLEQTYPNTEILICDNASTDGTEQICLQYAERHPQIRYVRNAKNLGALANYNLTLELASGEYFKWAAHDDVCHERLIEECVSVLQSEPDCELCFSSIRFIDHGGELIRESRPNLAVDAPSASERLRQLLRLEMASTDVFWSIFGVMRRRTLQKIGALPAHVASDQTLLLKLAIEGKLLQLDDALYSRREHKGASTTIARYSDRSAWYLGEGAARVVLPNLELCYQHVRISGLAGFGYREAAAINFLLCRRFARRWRFILREVASIPSQLLQSAK